MNPVGIVVVAAMMAAFIFYRWWLVSRAGEYNLRTEWPLWLAGAAAVAVSIVVTIAGRLAMLVLTPIILIPIGVLLLRRSASLRTVSAVDLRFGGWLAIVGGVLGGLAAVAELWIRP